ncbi:exoglucanase XynX-like [Haliotis rubra]|uniref:exoglucanase XynX-like n=1 Tax=Haliotis rubra TaxID=36100 RepID=UPI001EE5669E|nr:exoglucanase XynX-like [Haliotis rubra]
MVLWVSAFCVLFCYVSAATELLQNPGFEAPNPTSGWTCAGCSMSVSSDHHGGNHAVKVSGRQAYWAGVEQVVPLSPNTRYHIVAHLKQLNNLPDKMYQEYSILMQSLTDNGTRLYDTIVVDKTISTRTGWASLDCFIIYTYTGIKEVRLRVRGSDAAINFLVDDVSVTEVPENKNWKSESDIRIDQLRKSNVNFTVKVPSHASFADLDIQIDLTRHAFPFGSQTTWQTMAQYSHYNDLFYYMFNWATLSNYYWHSSPPPRDNPDYSNATHALDVLHQHGIPVRAHNMFWAVENQNPEWIRTLSLDQFKKAVNDRINYAVKDTKGRVQHWDVMNEMVQGRWYEEKTKDPDFTKKIFAKIHHADPNVKLFLNEDHVVSSGVYTSAYLALAKSFKAAGVGLYGMGLECHFMSNSPPDPTLMKLRLDHLGAVGLPLWTTEMDVVVHDENTRADWYDTALRMLFSHPAVEGIIFWGFWSVNHWRGPDAALVSGNSYHINAAGKRYLNLIHQEWSTHVTHRLTSGTQFNIRGFHGDYDIIVRYQGTPVKKQTFFLGKTDTTVTVDITDATGAISMATTKSPVDYQRPSPQHHVTHIGEHSIGHMTSGSSSQLSCITRFSGLSEVADDKYAEVTCPDGYVLTGCSGRSKDQRSNRDGEEMVIHSGAACRSVNGAATSAPVQAVARCCKMSGLTCDYRMSGPSSQVLDQRIETRCLNNMYATGCTAHTAYKYTDGSFPDPSLHSCLAQNQHSEGRVYSYAACCSAPHLTCQVKTSRPTGDAMGDESSVTCDDGWTLLGCTSYSEDAGLAGAYIRGNHQCIAVNGQERLYGDYPVTAYATCCRTR